jgi:ferric enterobactin receptor
MNLVFSVSAFLRRILSGFLLVTLVTTKIDTLVSTRNTSVIYLEPSEIMLKPIRVVHTEREVLQASPQPEKIAFNPLKSQNVPRISNDDMGNALLLIPGVNFLQGGSSGLSIRGGAPTDNLVLFDGIPVLETSHLLGNISVMNAKVCTTGFCFPRRI